MLIIETSIFAKRVYEVLADTDYRALQYYLTEHPEAGDIIQGTHGLRKLRWKIAGRGKRGGARIIYYWMEQESIVILLFIFKKNERDDITENQRKQLMNLLRKELP
jgi:mRNA-degrading endonuclease RelE of RelBE toxin-antitoxin system